MVLFNSCESPLGFGGFYIHPHSHNVYFSCPNDRTIFKYDIISSEVIKIIKISSYSPHPKSIHVSADENFIYYTCFNTIQKLDLSSGKSEMIAGLVDSSGFNGDGKPGKETSLSDPTSLQVFEEENEIYFLDICNNRVRKISSENIVETVLNLSEYPTFQKDTSRINSCYGRMEMNQSKNVIYVSNDKFHLYKFNLENNQAESVINFYGLNAWSLFNDQIYVVNYETILKVHSNKNPLTVLNGAKISYLKVISNDIAYAVIDNNESIDCSIIGLDGSNSIHSTIISYSSRNLIREKNREFLFGNANTYCIPKHLRDSKDELIYFEPLLKKVAPLFFSQMSLFKEDPEICQYLIDYCIYHNYNDFIGLKNHAKLFTYFKNSKFDPILEPLKNYIQELNGISKQTQTTSSSRPVLSSGFGFGFASQLNKPTNPILTEPSPVQTPEQLPTSNNKMEYLQELFNDDDTFDFSILLNGKVLKCHKTIISKSKFFKTMLESISHFADTKDDSFQVDEGTNSTLLEIIVKHCYDFDPDINSLTVDELVELVDMCKIHELDSLETNCIENLKITFESFDQLCKFVQISEVHEFHNLRSKLIEFAMNHTHEIIENIYGGQLFEISPFVLQHLMQSIPKWAQHQFMKLKN